MPWSTVTFLFAPVRSGKIVFIIIKINIHVMDGIIQRCPGIIDWIKKGILKIRRKDCSKPCYQTVLKYVRENGMDIEMDELVLAELIANNVIVKKVKSKRISLYVNEENDNTSDEENSDGHLDINKILGEGEEFINKQFYETLITCIKLEVKNAIKELTPNILISDKRINNDIGECTVCNTNKRCYISP